MKVAWRKVKIGDVCETSLGKMLDTKKNKGKMHCYLNNVAVRWGTFDLSNLPEMCFTQDDKNRYTIKRGDVVICEGGEPGRCAIWKSDEPIFFQKALHRIRMKEGLFNEYFYYSFRHLVMSGATRKYETGSTIRHLSRQSLNQIDIHIPPQEVQRKIAKILSSIDDKIEVNTKINHNLEEQAKALFKSWFIDFEPFKDGEFVDSELGKIPKGWRVGTLDEIGEITMGQSPDGSSYNEESLGCVFYQGRAEFTDRFPIRRLFTTEPKRMAAKGDILLSDWEFVMKRKALTKILAGLLRRSMGILTVRIFPSCCLVRVT